MKWPFNRHKHYTLTGDSCGSLLAESMCNKQGKPDLNVVSSTCGGAIDDITNLNRLLSSVSKKSQGKVAVSLPLAFFDTVTLGLPAMPNEAISQALPYHLAKTISSPLRDYLYDWQITSRSLEKIQLTAYLLPTKTFTLIQRELARKQMEISYLDCDLFSAFSLLAVHNQLNNNNATLCLLLWPSSVSIGIYENKIITLARSFSLELPKEEFSLTTETIVEPLFDTGDDPPELNGFSDNDDNSILMDLGILDQSSPLVLDQPLTEQPDQQQGGDEPLPDSVITTQMMSQGACWSEYLERVNIEVMRTRDYYISLIKGAPIQHAFMGGADQCLGALTQLTKESLGIQFLPLYAEEENIEGCQPIYSVICRGAGTRW